MSTDPHGKLILVVDDDPLIIRAVTGTLAMAGFRALVAEHGAAGLEAFLKHADEIDLVLSDIVMPMMDGTTMAERIKKAKPDARILLMTAYSDAVIDLINDEKFPLVRKPFLPEDLLRAVKAQVGPTSAEAS